MLLSQKGDVAGALRSARGIVNAGRSLYDEPLAISQLIRIACVAIAVNAAERSLSLGEAPDAELAALQRLLADEEKHPTLLVVMRGERAVFHDLWTKLISG